MQFTGKKGIALFVVLISGACIVGFGSGLLVGRQFPAHHFVQFGNPSYLLDTSTGKICKLTVFEDKTQNSTSGISMSDFIAGGPPPCEK
jgi:hypothetical protein